MVTMYFLPFSKKEKSTVALRLLFPLEIPTSQLVQNTLSIDENTDSARVFVSTTGDIYFGEKGQYELEIFNLQWKRILNKSLDTQKRNQKVNFGLIKGLYLLKVKNDSSTNSFVKKMLIY